MTLEHYYCNNNITYHIHGCGEECGKEEECRWPVCSEVYARNVIQDSKTKQGRLRRRQVLLAVVKE
jgi:hypothetical protein